MEAFLSGNNQTTAVFSEVDLKLVVVDVSLVTDNYSLSPLLGDLDIHGNDNYVPIEFAGALAAVFFTVSIIEHALLIKVHLLAI